MDTKCEILIVGAGLGGVGAAIDLIKNGFDDLVILEKAHDVGGTWRDHRYPGLTVDISTSLYQFTYEKNPDWSTFFAPRAELFEYIRHCASKYGVYPHVRFGVQVEKSVYDEKNNVWRTHTTDGRTFVSRYLIAATGFLNVVKFPEIRGIEQFRGKKIHTSFWSEDTKVDEERVGFIGTGATAIQLIPEIAQKVARLDVYQRTPIWLLPKNDAPLSGRFKWTMRSVPGAMWLVRMFSSLLFDYVIIAALLHYRPFRRLFLSMERKGIEHIRASVRDPGIQEKLIPKYSLGCKRLSFSNKYYPVFNRSNVELVTTAIDRITEDSIITADGAERKIDTLVCATGYEVFSKESAPTFPVYGNQGVELRKFWDENRFQAFRGVSVAGFPNYFMINGPYSVSHASYIAMIQDGARHIIRCLKAAKRRRANYIEVKHAVMIKDFEACTQGKQNMVFTVASCGASNSYYFDRHGDVPTFRPSNRFSVWLYSHVFSLNNYHFVNRGIEDMPGTPVQHGNAHSQIEPLERA